MVPKFHGCRGESGRPRRRAGRAVGASFELLLLAGPGGAGALDNLLLELTLELAPDGPEML